MLSDCCPSMGVVIALAHVAADASTLVSDIGPYSIVALVLLLVPPLFIPILRVRCMASGEPCPAHKRLRREDIVKKPSIFSHSARSCDQLSEALCNIFRMLSFYGGTGSAISADRSQFLQSVLL